MKRNTYFLAVMVTVVTWLSAGCNKEDPARKAGNPPDQTAFPAPLTSREANGAGAGTIPSKNRPRQTILHWVEKATIEEGGDGHTKRIVSLCFSPDGQTLATGSIDSSLKLWEVATGKLRKTFARTLKPVALAFSPDGKTLAVGSHGEMQVALLDPETGKPNGQFTDPKGYEQDSFKALRTVAYTSDGARFAAGGDDERVRVWDTATGKLVHNFESGLSAVQSVAFTPDGKTLAAGDVNGRVYMWDLASGRSQEVDRRGKNIYSVAFSPDGKLLAYCGTNNSAKVWSLADKKEVAAFKGSATNEKWMCDAVAFSPDGRFLAVGCGHGLEGGSLKLIDVAEMKERGAAPSSLAIRCLAFSKDGRSMAFGTHEGWNEAERSFLKSKLVLWESAGK